MNTPFQLLRKWWSGATRRARAPWHITLLPLSSQPWRITPLPLSSQPWTIVLLPLSDAEGNAETGLNIKLWIHT